MKRSVCLGLMAMAACILLLAACREAPPAAEPSGNPTSQTGETAHTDMLLMDFTSGSNVEDVRPVELEHSISASELCDTLEQVTGIQFDFTIQTGETGSVVTWQESSALVQGETPQDEQQDYVFYDDDLLRWFMLDTVWRNLTEEFGAASVVYAGPDGTPLRLEEPWPLGDFDLSEPYQGSSWYCAQYTEASWDSDGMPES